MLFQMTFFKQFEIQIPIYRVICFSFILPCFLSLYTLPLHCNAQIAEQVVSFPSPNAATLGLFTSVPVSNFTGAPNISIPLYEIQEGSFKMPITLDYHISSIRVHSHPGWVGLGWSLNVGGAITRVMHGKIDEYYAPQLESSPSGFYGQYATLAGSETEWYSSTRLNQYKNAYLPGSSTSIESMPDEFSFNFLGYSGTFFMGHDGMWKVVSDDDIKIIFNPVDGDGFISMANLRPRISDRIQYYGNATDKSSWSSRYFNKFTLVTPDGNSFEFGGRMATEYSVPFTNEIAYPVPVTWFLSKITTSTGRTVNFSYTEGNTISSFMPMAYKGTGFRDGGSRGFLADFFSVNTGVNCYINQRVNPTDIDGNLIFPMYLNVITYSNGAINFNTSTSQELRWPDDAMIDYKMTSQTVLPVYFVDPYSSAIGIFPSGTTYGNQLQWAKLDNILIYDYKGSNKGSSNFVKQFAFTYNNSSVPVTSRLRLLKLTESVSGGVIKPPYIFGYNTTYLPSYSEAVKYDHWDFFNGTTLTPVLSAPFTQYYSTREPDATGAFMKAETLESIQYPTGGSTLFEWEPHNYSEVVDRTNISGVDSSFPLVNLGINKTAGGLRIRSISFYNSLSDNAPIQKKQYYYVKNYTQGANPSTLTSSGCLGGYPVYYWPNYSAKDIGGNSYTFSIFSSGSLLPFGFNTAGNHLGYSEVVEVSLDRSGATNGFTKYKYTNFETDIWGNSHSDLSGITIDPARSAYSPCSSVELQRGKLLSEEVYSSTLTQPIQSTKFQYTLSSTGYVRRVLQDPMDICSQIVASAQTCYVTAFRTYLYRYNLTGKTVATSDGTNTISTAYTYAYNSQNLVGNTTQSTSDGNVISSTMTYAPDYTSNTSLTSTDWMASGISALVNKHQINVPIEVTTFRNGFAINSELTGYKLTGGLNLPFQKWNLETNLALTVGVPIGYNTGQETDKFNSASLFPNPTTYQFVIDEHYTKSPVLFNTYDAAGNIQEYSRTNGVKVTYLWSYASSYPIAEIVGASFLQVSSALASFNVDVTTLSNSFPTDSQIQGYMSSLRSLLPNAMITSYTYNPYGISSKVDPSGLLMTYDYDSWGRLQDIRDNKNNVVKSYQYHYQGQN